MSSEGLSRRNMVLLAGAAAGAVALPAAVASPAAAAPALQVPVQAAVPLAVNAQLRKTLNYGWHVARRLSLAPTHALAEEINKAGWQKWVQAQIRNDGTFSSQAADTLISTYYPSGVISHEADKAFEDKYRYAGQNRAANMLRRVYTNKHLREVMVEFWGDLVHVSSNSDAARSYITDFDNRQRRYALGKFSDLLYQSTISPSMLKMLTNTSNTKRSVNENLGREIMELHTVGVNGGFTEVDVKQSALLFTGIRVNSLTLRTEFVPKNHYYGPLKIMGFRHANTPATSGEKLVRAYTDYLSSHPSTARRIADRLVARFCYEEVDAKSGALAASLARTYLANATDIRPVLTELFNSAVFKGSIGRKIARPSHIIARNYAAMKPVFTPSAGSFKEDIGHYSIPPSMDSGLKIVENEYRGHTGPDGSPDSGVYWMSANTFRYVVGTLAETTGGQSDDWFVSRDWAKILGVNTGMTVTEIAKRLYGRIHGFHPDASTLRLLVQTISRFGVDSKSRPVARALQNDTIKLPMQLVFAAPHSFIR